MQRRWRTSTGSWALVGVLAAAAAPTVLAQQGQPPMQRHRMKMQQAAERHDAMMQKMQQSQQELDRLVQRMEAAQGQEKVDAMAAVVKELVAQRQARLEQMQEMHQRMMEMRGGAGTPPSADPGNATP